MNDVASLKMTVCSVVENLILKFKTDLRTRKQHFDVMIYRC